MKATLLKTTILLLVTAGAVTEAAAISPNSVEVELGHLARTHTGQQRPEMIHDPVLNAVARAKAFDLARRNYFSHVDPDGFGPNRVAQLVGYELPGWYGSDKSSNYIESIGGGAGSAAQQFSSWLGSSGHRAHLLGTNEFYAEQTHYGVGYAEVAGSRLRRYYVFISAPPPEAGGGDGPYADWLLQQFLPKSLESTDDMTDHDGDGISRLQEFVLGFEPRTPNVLPSPTLSSDSRRLEWRLPLRETLGSITARVERSGDLKSWTREDVNVEPGGLFSIPIDEPLGALRLAVDR
ncbi:MAG: CAP domain-containing protein [Verrucomicrobiales bacterium]